MTAKSLIAAAALSLSLAAMLAPAPAEAKTHVDFSVGIGVGPGYYGPAYPGYYGPVGYYEPDYGGISCWKAQKIVAGHGFHNVHAIDCSAPNYKFTGWKGGDKYRVRVNSWGNITGVSAY